MKLTLILINGLAATDPNPEVRIRTAREVGEGLDAILNEYRLAIFAGRIFSRQADREVNTPFGIFMMNIMDSTTANHITGAELPELRPPGTNVAAILRAARAQSDDYNASPHTADPQETAIALIVNDRLFRALARHIGHMLSEDGLPLVLIAEVEDDPTDEAEPHPGPTAEPAHGQATG